MFINMIRRRKKTAIGLLSLVLAVLFSGAVSAATVEPGAALIPGGMPFGAKFSTEGLSVVGYSDVDAEGGDKNPAKESGIELGDRITSIDGAVINSVTEFIESIQKSEGRDLKIQVKRGTDEIAITLKPALSKSENKYKIGVWVRDSAAGIGTVTFVVPQTGAFAGLGHGICDTETGEVLGMTRGVVTKVTISGIAPGVPGTPGELKGVLGAEKTGTLVGNTHEGVFGIFSEEHCPSGEALPLAAFDEIKEGSAEILCTLDNGACGRYTIEIQSKSENDGNKNFVLCVTDPALLEKTGGIVQGMSGSPIIQGGKLVGAVTHVFVNDPTRGYGIYIGNMLESMPDILS